MAYEQDRVTTTTTTPRTDRPYTTNVTTTDNGSMWAIIGGLVDVALGVLWYVGVFGDGNPARTTTPTTTIENNVNEAPAAPATNAPAATVPAAPAATAPVQTAPEAAPADPAPAAPAPAAPAAPAPAP